MSIFVDTSALYALLDRDDANHQAAKGIWTRLLHTDALLVTHNYILVETTALVQHRLGMDAVRTLQEDLLPLIDVVWIDEKLHATAIGLLLAAQHRHISLVDWASFENMRHRGIREAFAFDPDFVTAGYQLLQ